MPGERLDEFYVGYLPASGRTVRFVRTLAAVLAVVIAVTGAFIVAGMRDPGAGSWDTTHEQAWHGVLRSDPYPMLVPDDGSTPYLVVEMAKHGAQDDVAPFDGARVTLMGFALARDGRRMIELSPDRPIERLDDAPTRTPERDLGPVVVEGELVDGKCYLGAMKPGDGAAHKSCATLCVRGGLPPMVVGRSDGSPVFTLLVFDAGPMPEGLLPLIAEPVRVRGRLREIDGLRFVRVAPADIDRLP